MFISEQKMNMDEHVFKETFNEYHRRHDVNGMNKKGSFLKGLSLKAPAQPEDLVRKYGQEFCELCLRKENDMPGPQTLEAHHVVEHQSGGGEGRENIWIVCTACHRLIHLRRQAHDQPPR